MGGSNSRNAYDNYDGWDDPYSGGGVTTPILPYDYPRYNVTPSI